MTVKIARMAAVFTTTSETLAERYRSEGVNRIQVIPNQLDPEMARPRIRHDGLVIGWVAGRDHLADVARIPLADALTQLMARHRKVQVHCIGLDLELPQRYIHTPGVPFAELPQHVGAFDVGIAPLADIPANWARSDIKLKEYAASGVPWLASPIGPYVGLGEAQGGRLVADASWPEALEGLVARKRDRRRLARNGLRWASEQTVDAVADRWEAVFVQAKERSRRR
jgi:glycosyltransferase involved in cell wall biosynthesis